MSPSGVKQLAPLFSCPNDTTSAKQLSYCLEKQILFYACKNRFLDISHGPELKISFVV